MSEHRCQPPTIAIGGTHPQQPDWTCGECGRLWRDWNGGGSSPVRWWAEIRGPSPLSRTITADIRAAAQERESDG